MNKRRIDPRKIGKVGEHRVIAELLLRGWNPMVATIDEGIDIILDNGKTIQVKSVSTTIYGSRKNSACVSIATTRYDKGVRLHPSINQDRRADFFIILVIPWNEFFIIPKEVISSGLLNITITPKEKSKYYQYKGKWELLGK